MREVQDLVDAGDRWAYWLLEDPKLVTLGERVVAEDVLGAASYWDPPPEERNDWLCVEILPSVRAYLIEHRGHALIYLEEDMLMPDGPRANWAELRPVNG